MYRLNITFIVEPRAFEEWMGTVRGSLLPLLGREGFDKIVFSRVLSDGAQGHATFSLLVEIETMERYSYLTGTVWHEYVTTAGYASDSDVLWFMTLMKEIDGS